MQSFGDEDGACDGQVVLAGDQWGATKVSGSANALKDRREGDEALDVRVGERVLASRIRRDASSRQGSSEKLDVFFLVVGNVLQIVVVGTVIACEVVRRRRDERQSQSRTSLLEVLLRELRQGTFVEDVLEVLKGQSELQDRGIDVVAWGEWCSPSDGGQERHGGEDGVLHCEV